MEKDQNKKRTRKFFPLLLLFSFIGALAAFYFPSLFSQDIPSFALENAFSKKSQRLEESLKRIKQENLIENERFLRLESHGGLPIPEARIGKRNPFKSKD